MKAIDRTSRHEKKGEKAFLLSTAAAEEDSCQKPTRWYSFLFKIEKRDLFYLRCFSLFSDILVEA